MSNGKHAILSPSSAHRWTKCIGAPATEKGEPDNSNEYSREGTAAHALAKMAWDEQKNAEAYVGRRIEVDNLETVEVTEEMAEEVQKYLNICKALAVNGDSFAEVMVPIGHITGEEGAEGQADFVVVDANAKELICCDLKFGRGVQVVAKDNLQLILYLLGVYDEYSLVYDIQSVRGIISQPRLDNTDEETWTVAQLEEYRELLKRKAAFAWEAYAETDPVKLETWRLAGDAQCQWCKAKATCPTAAKHVEKALGIEFTKLSADIADPVTLVTETQFIPDSPSELGVKMDAVDFVEGWCKAVRSRVEKQLLEGVAVDSPSGGYKIVQGRKGARYWSSDDDATKQLKSFRLKDEEMYTFKLISPTQAEKLLKAQPKRWTKLEKLIGQTDGGKSVAPMSDKRPAVQIEAPTTDEFSVVDAGDDLI